MRALLCWALVVVALASARAEQPPAQMPQSGPAGRGIASAAIASGQFVLTYTDGSTATLGQVVGTAGAPKCVERYTQPANASGVATFTWPACATTPDVDIIPGWATIGGVQQMVTGGVASSTLSGATVAVKVSQGTIALSGTPFRQADSGTASTIRVICN